VHFTFAHTQRSFKHIAVTYVRYAPKEAIMATTTMVHVRVDENIKAQAAKALASMGLTISDAIRIF
jgi:hypothetical protein